MDAAELARWTRFAAKGGIGNCTATQDCVAERAEDLMFLKDDKVTVLMQLPDQEGLYLGYCEGVVGRFQGTHVRFHSKLKKPVMAKRSSTSNSSFSKGSSSSSSPNNPSEISGLRVLVSSPPPLAINPATQPPPEVIQPYSPLQLSPEEETMVVPSKSYSSTSSPSDSALDTPPQTTNFDHGTLHTDSRLSASLLVDHVVRKSNDNLTLPISTDVAARGATNRASTPSIYEDDPGGDRVSLTLSDGEVGIGLSLLQDFAGGGGDGDDWSDSSGSDGDVREGRSESRTPDLKSPHGETFELVGSTAEGSPTEITTASIDMRPVSQARPTSRGAPSTVSSRVSTQGSQSDDWEGASDIYENYRYSRLSMSSKMSRYSQGSTSAVSEVPPPIPRQSMDSQLQSGTSVHTVSSRTSNPPPANLSTTGGRKDRPASLKLTAASPLLHTSFGSPVTSSRVQSGSSSLLSMTASATSLSPPLGSTSSLRGKPENGGRPTNLTSPIEVSKNEEHPQRRIIIEDDEESSGFVVAHSAQDNSPRAAVQGTFPGHAAPEASQVVVPLPVSTPSGTPASPPDNLSLSSFPFPPQQIQLRPPMSETLSSQYTGPIPKRASLFLPHPNAPKPSNSPFGPMYARQVASPSLTGNTSFPVPMSHNVPGRSTIYALHQAAAARFTPNGQIRRTTIYGRCEFDLSRADGPVPIAFTLDPPPAAFPSRLGINTPPPLNAEMRSFSPARSPVPSSPSIRNGISSSASAPQMPSASSGGDGSEIPVGNVIARRGFTPQAKGVRPRSRSFSAFNSQEPDPPRLNHNEGNGGPALAIVLPPDRGSRAQSIPAPSPTPSSDQVAASGTLISRSPHPPSPLSMPHNDTSLSSMPNSAQSPTSPISPVSPSSYGSSPSMSSSPGRQGPNKLRKAASSAALHNEDAAFPVVPTPPLRIPKRNTSLANAEPLMPSNSISSRRNPLTAQDSSNSSQTMPPIPRSNRAVMQEISLPPTWHFPSRKGSAGTVSSQDSERRVASPLPNGSGVIRNTSLRKKLSLPSLRSRSIQIPRPDEIVDNTSNNDQENEMVQAENVEFELIRPSMPQASERTSEDSAFMPRDQTSLQLEGRPSITGYLRTDSPAISLASGASSAPRSPTAESVKTVKSDAELSMDAHRQRELKWMSLISSVPAAQARRNKKVKKLLMEGVPSSVRYLVWAHLMDSKARGMPGLYSQLGKRGKVPAFDDIERDCQRCYPDQPQLHTAQGTLVALLQSYFTMVPDIHYEIGLTYIAGRLLILAPDEDAFWIFVSLMDTYLRPWFSANTIQMEVDASLFSKALETNDGLVAKKLYVELGISQTAVCRPWFASLFTQSLPVEYLNRVWDNFLYEGVVFLFRVGLTLIHCCRHYLLQSDGEASALEYMVHPPASCLPITPEAFIALAYSFKLKDDDVRKQRIKMEAQVKRQTQMRVLSVPGLAVTKTGSAISLPKS